MTRRRWWLLVGLVVVVWAAVSALLLVRAAGSLRDGRDAATAAKDGLDASTLADGSAVPGLRRARDRFGSAAASTGNPVLLPLKVLPVVGRQLRSVHALASAAHEVTAAAAEAAERAHVVLEHPKGGGAARLAIIDELHDAVAKAARRVDAVDDLGPRVGLVGPLADARNELADQMADARSVLADATAGSAAGLRLLEGPRRYLLVAANNAEMRAGSGMWLSGGLLRTAGGRFDLGDISPLYDVADPANGAVPIADRDLADRWGALFHPNWDWRSLMPSPRLAASAELASRMWRNAGKEAIDGVLVVDPVALAAVVRATGPVTVQGRTIDADQVAPFLLNEQYTAYGTEDAQTGARREALGAIASAAFDALDAGEWSPQVLATELARAVAGRHVLAWSSNPQEQRGWEAAGLDGRLTSDSMLVSLINAGANKLDWYTPLDVAMTTAEAGSGTDVALRVRIRNTSPPGLPRYVGGPPGGREWPAGRYVGILAVDVPGAATDLRIDGRPTPLLVGPDGDSQVIASDLHLDRGESVEIVVRFHLRGYHGKVVVEPSARIPAANWVAGSRRWQDSEPRTVKW